MDNQQNNQFLDINQADDIPSTAHVHVVQESNFESIEANTYDLISKTTPKGLGLAVAGIAFGLIEVSAITAMFFVDAAKPLTNNLYSLIGLVALGIIGLIIAMSGKFKAIDTDNKNPIINLSLIITIIALIGSFATVILFGYSYFENVKKTAEAKSNAGVVKLFAEKFNENRSTFPDEISDFDEGKVNNKNLSEIVELTDAIDQNSATNEIVYQYVGEYGAATGAKITYYDYSNENISSDIVYLGDASQSSTFVDIK